MDEVNKVLIINCCQNNIILIVCEHSDVRNQIRYSKTMEGRQTTVCNLECRTSLTEYVMLGGPFESASATLSIVGGEFTEISNK